MYIWEYFKNDLIFNFPSKWNAGEEKISAIATIPNSNRILTSSKSIKLWDVVSKALMKTFTGHSSDIIFLHVVSQLDKQPSYVISGSKVKQFSNKYGRIGQISIKISYSLQVVVVFYFQLASFFTFNNLKFIE